MKPPPLQRHVARFEERNDFAYALLGARRLARAYVQLVEQQPEDRKAESAGPSTESDYVLLGLYSVARTVSELTDAWSLPVADREQSTASPRHTEVGLLR